MKKSSIILILTILVLFILVTACSPGGPSVTTPPSTTVLDGATLVQERCTVCHSLAYVEKSRHTPAEWQIIVETMVSRGASLSPEEESIVIKYLATTFGQ